MVADSNTHTVHELRDYMETKCKESIKSITKLNQKTKSIEYTFIEEMKKMKRHTDEQNSKILHILHSIQDYIYRKDYISGLFWTIA